MSHERDLSDQQLYGAEDAEELEAILSAMDRTDNATAQDEGPST